MPGSVAERIYYRLPVGLQDLVFSAYGWKLRRQRYNRHFYERLCWLEESDWWSAEAIQRFQDEQIRRIVRHAYETVPFYRRWYDEHGVVVDAVRGVADLEKLPILTKQLVREHRDELVSTAVPRRALIKTLTSGTTGSPLAIDRTYAGTALQWAIWWRHKARFGLRPDDRHLMFGARVPIDIKQRRPPYWRRDWANRRVYLSTYHIAPRTVGDIVAYLNREAFAFYTGYPSAIHAFATLVEKAGLKLERPPRYVVTGSDALLPAFEAKIRDVIRAPVTEQYGMAEFAGNLSKCPEGRFHVDFECGAVECPPLANLPDYGDLILTGWGEAAMPFIRYQVGDYAKPLAGRCACGRESACFESVGGRLEDYVKTPDGRLVMGMNQVLEYAEHVHEIQIYQDRLEAVELRIVPTPGYGEADEAALRRELQRRLGGGMAIVFRLVDEIPRTAGGKFKAVVSELDEARIGS